MRKRSVIAGIVLAAVTVIASIPVSTVVQAATEKPAISVSVTKDTVNKKKATETTTFKVRNKSDEDITIKAFANLPFYPSGEDGGLYVWHTKDKKDVKIPVGESKKITLTVKEMYSGVIGKKAEKESGVAFYIVYDGKYFTEEWRGAKKKNTTLKVREKIKKVSKSEYDDMVEYFPG